jgi:hypothetical protein
MRHMQEWRHGMVMAKAGKETQIDEGIQASDEAQAGDETQTGDDTGR